ncbi:MAG: hypothetical protein ACOYYS_02485 [Chloroflexota bacterium]
MLRKHVNFYLGLLAIALTGVVLVLLVTRWGAFVSDDSYYYIKPVRDALAGNGFDPSPIFPPGLPLALLPLGWLGLDPLVAVRWLNACLFGVNILLGGVLVKRMGASAGFALLAALWVASAENVLEAHAWAMSEALCLTFTLSALYLALEYGLAPRRWALVAAALAAAAACITRYAALPVVAAIAVALLAFGRGRLAWKRRFLDAGVFTSIALLPMGLYVLRSAAILGRPLYYSAYTNEPFTFDNLTWYLYNTLNWFVPGRFLRGHELWAGLGALVLLTIGSAAWWLFRRRQGVQAQPVSIGLWLLLLYVLMNYLLLFFARGLAGLAAYNARYLVLPLFVFLLAGAYLADLLWRAGRQREPGENGRWRLAAVRGGIGVLLLVFTLYYGYRVADYARQTAETGLGYLNSGWHTSETIPFLERHPETPLVATGDVGIYFWTGRLPKVITAFDGPHALHAYICEEDGFLVIMKQMPTEIYAMDEAIVVGDLALVQEFNDGKIYRCLPAP